MKRILTFLILYSLADYSFCQEINVASVMSASKANMYVRDNPVIFNDSIVYIVGSFESMIEFGEIQLTSNYSRGIFLLKTNISGEILSLNKIADNQFFVVSEPSIGLDVDSSENIIIGIGFKDSIFYTADSNIALHGGGFLLMKFDKTLTLIWENHYQTIISGLNGVKIDKSNNVLISGRANDDFFIMKLNSQGDSLWTKTGGSSSSGAPVAGGVIAIDVENNYYCSGFLTTSNSVYFDTEHPIFNPLDFGKYGSFLAKYDSNGNIQWLKCLFASSEQIQFAPITSVDIENGNVLIGGYFNSNFLRSSPNEGSIGASNPYGLNRGFLIMYDSAGNRIWSKVTHVLENGENEARFVQFVDDGGFYCASSFTESMNIQADVISGGTYGNVLIEKYSLDGTPESYFLVEGQNRERLDGFYKIDADFILIGSTNSNPLYFNGTSVSLTTNPSFFIAKLHDNFVSLEENERQMYSIFPNPTSGKVQIYSQNSLKGEEASVYNMLGEQVYQQQLSEQFSNELYLPQPAGLYVLKVCGQTLKIVKE